MTTKTKLWLFYIFTFGIGYLIAKNRAKSLLDSKDNKISSSQTTETFINKVIECIGGLENIIDLTPTINSIKFEVKEPKSFNQDDVKKHKIKGSFVNGNKVTLLLGDESKDVAEKIKEKLTK